MKNKRYFWGLISVAAVIILAIVFKVSFPVLNPSAETLSESEAKTLVEDRYDGQVTEIVLKNNQYVMQLVRDGINYGLKLDAEYGEVISLTKQSTLNGDSNKEPIPPQVNSLTENAMKQKVLSEFPGELVLFIKLNEQGKSQYKAIIKQDGKRTIIKVDAQTGEILFQKSENEAAVIISEDDAVQIALNQVKGQINDVDLETEDNLNYYLVEIDTSDKQEATVQIHAITGEVLSITWDD